MKFKHDDNLRDRKYVDEISEQEEYWMRKIKTKEYDGKFHFQGFFFLYVCLFIFFFLSRYSVSLCILTVLELTL